MQEAETSFSTTPRERTVAIAKRKKEEEKSAEGNSSSRMEVQVGTLGTTLEKFIQGLSRAAEAIGFPPRRNANAAVFVYLFQSSRRDRNS